MAATAPPNLVDAGPSKGIAIGGWSITATKVHILDTAQSDA